MAKMRVARRGRWSAARRMLQGLPLDYKTASDLAVREEAKLFKTKAKEAIRTSGASNGEKWPPNTKATRAGKRSRKPLINTRMLLRAIAYKRERRGRYTVGIQDRKTPDGKRLSDIAMVHERGALIIQTVTKAQFRAVMAKVNSKRRRKVNSKRKPGRFKPGAVMVIRIPKRSFMFATYDAHFDGKSYKRIAARVKALMYPKYKAMTMADFLGKGRTAKGHPSGGGASRGGRAPRPKARA